MATPPPDKPADFTASDILSADAWTGRVPKPVLGIDVVCTKIAVDFQNMNRDSVDECVRRNLELLRGATGSDCAFLAALNPEDSTIADVQLARSAFAQCRPEGLTGSGLESFPWLRGRLENLRLSELRDTSAPRKEQALEAAKFAGLHIGSALLVALRVQGKPAGFLALAHAMPRGAWDVNLQLLMKLIGTSLATGLERIRIEARLAKLEERTNLFQAAANDGMWDFDVESNEVYFSPRWKAMLGYGDDDMRGAPDWRALVHPDDLSRVQTAIRDHVAGKTPIFESTHRMRHRNGEWRWVISRATARVDKHGRLLRLVGVEFDITERKLYEEALFREKESAQITLQSIGDGVITTDAHSTIDYINPVAEELTGWRLEDAMGRPVEEIFRAFHEETCEPLENPLSVSVRRMRPIKSVRPMLLIRRDGNELYVESTAAPIRDGSGHVAGGVLVFHDVSESRELNRRLSYHASHDLLTGLVNRREFESRMERALKSAKAREASYALCYLDIDQFKIVNDTCGHSAGDALLGQVGALLKSKVRWRDTLSRLGRDPAGELLAGRGDAHRRDPARGRAQLPLHLGGPGVSPGRQHWCRADHRRQRGCRLDPVGRRQRLRRRQGGRSQPRPQLRGKRHRAHAPAARDAVGGAHQRGARGRALRAVPHGDPAAAAGRGRRALRAAAAPEGRGRAHRRAQRLHRRGRALRHHPGDRSLGDRECVPLAGVRFRRAREPLSVLHQPLRTEPGG